MVEVAVSSALPVELDDIQGLVRFGYKHHTEASFLLLRVTDPDAARRADPPAGALWETSAVLRAAPQEPRAEAALHAQVAARDR